MDHREAAARLYREFGPAVYRRCLRLLRGTTGVGRRGEEALSNDLETDERSAAEALPDRRLAQELLNRFDASTQAVVVGVFVDGMEREEVASALGISKRTVSRRLERFLSSSRRFTGKDLS